MLATTATLYIVIANLFIHSLLIKPNNYETQASNRCNQEYKDNQFKILHTAQQYQRRRLLFCLLLLLLFGLTCNTLVSTLNDLVIHEYRQTLFSIQPSPMLFKLNVYSSVSNEPVVYFPDNIPIILCLLCARSALEFFKKGYMSGDGIGFCR